MKTSIELKNGEIGGLKNNLLENEGLITQVSILKAKVEELTNIEQKKLVLESEILEVNESKLKMEKEYSFLIKSSNLKAQELESLAKESNEKNEKLKIELEDSQKLCGSLERDLAELKSHITQVKFEDEKSAEKVQLEKQLLESELMDLKTRFNSEMLKELDLKLDEANKKGAETIKEMQNRIKELTQKETLAAKEVEELKQTIIFNEQEQMLMSEELKTTNSQCSEFLQKYEDITTEFDKLQNEYQACLASETEKVSALNLEVKTLQSSSALKFDNLMVKTKQIEQLYNDAKLEKDALERKIMEIEIKLKEEIQSKTKLESDLLMIADDYKVLFDEKLESERKRADDAKIIEGLEIQIKKEADHCNNLEILNTEMIKNIKSENKELAKKEQELNELKIKAESQLESMIHRNELETIEKLLSEKESELIAKEALFQEKQILIQSLENDLNVVRVYNF